MSGEEPLHLVIARLDSESEEMLRRALGEPSRIDRLRLVTGERPASGIDFLRAVVVDLEARNAGPPRLTLIEGGRNG